MRRVLVRTWTFAALAGLLAAAGGSAQPPAPKETAPPERLGVEAVIERLMAFDANKDGKLTKAELPERLHPLFDRGDLNKDGVLDADEVRKLAQTPGVLGDGREGGRRGGGAVNLERVIDDLGVRGEKRQKARAAVQAHQETVRKLLAKAQADLLETMKGILSEAELKEFKAAVERPTEGERPREGGRAGEPKRDR